MSGGRLVLIFNAGSSSLKFEIFDSADGLRSIRRGAVRDIGRASSSFETDRRTEVLGRVADAGEAAAAVLDRLGREAGGIELSADRIAATGHRVVHGGDRFSSPVRVTVSAFDTLKSLAHLAPLHNPQSLAVMEAVGERYPDVPIVAVFDTAFFHDLPASARCYAVPAEWAERHAIRRYGFHGIAHEYLSRQLPGGGRSARAVTLHLGQGCSVAALRDGRPLDTSMGLTPLEGLIMGTRCGDLDPGVVLHLARQGLGWKEIEEALNRRSGLLGLSGASDDVRELLALESDGHEGAGLALAAFCHRARKYLGAYAAVLGGLDAVAVGGGIGENSPEMRARIFDGLGWMGLELDREANARCVGERARVSAGSSAVEVHVIPVDEEPIIAEAVLEVLGE